ncbi:MAG: hypothetical protein GF383_00260 [Candidatus Lokiarchaeota archaeon]|nr:hypothetical protein [Candidatus Lokiarchaeota archaeon]MBD3337527.1 hypothetical protein [Candidatus Lokiarchaeota archaeon]
MRKDLKIEIMLGLAIALFLIAIVNPNQNDLKPDINSKEIALEDYYENNIKAADPEITLLTPENKTYNEVMSGYYPGTHSFENDADGSFPYNWTDYSHEYGYIEVISEKRNHKKVLKCYSKNYTQPGIGRQMYEVKPVSGTIEWWMLSSDVSKHSYFSGYNNFYLNAFCIRFYNGKIQYQIGPNWVEAMDAVSNTWYHVRVEFDCAIDKYTLWINENQIASAINFNNLGDTMHYTIVKTIDTDCELYIDAIGYSWYPNYDIGDNYMEGLLLSFQNDTNLDWMGYSLDGQSNTTVFGNTTIVMPQDGFHTIQVFGEDSIGTIHQSDKRHFTVDVPLILTSPQNKTYTEPMIGYYPGTYSFENDEIGDIPQEWIDISEGNGYIEVIESWDNHKKLLRIRGLSGMDDGHAVNTFSSNQNSGTIEFYWGHNATGCSRLWIYNELNQYAIHISLFYGNKLSYYNDSYQNIASISENKLHHIKLEFDCDTDTYDIFLDGVLVKNDAEFQNPATNLSKLRFNTDGDRSAYIDALGYSWDPSYEIGDNLDEGLLVKFEEHKIFDWIGYSLNNQENVTILGDKVIAMPEEGSQTLQVFANDSLGTNYASNLRYFHYYQDAVLPDEISLIDIHQGVLFIYLNWTITDDFGAPLWYNVYRGTNEGGYKKLLGTTTNNYYNDTSAIVGTRYYYVVEVENVIGKSANSSEVNGVARDAPYIEWQSPTEYSHIKYPQGVYCIFNFEYDKAGVDEVKLYLNGFDYGSVWNKELLNFTYHAGVDGIVNATLIGYYQGAFVIQESRNFTFAKIIHEVTEMLDSGRKFLGNQLYLILHDPHGDNSYSGYAESTSLSVKTTSTHSFGYGIGVEVDVNLFWVQFGGSLNLEQKSTDSNKAEFVVTDTSELTSSLESENKNFIGPGYGDRYWGEAVTYNWQLRAFKREYFNNTVVYEDAKVYWGLIRSNEVFLSDHEAPESWRAQNPVHNGWQNVEWTDIKSDSGGAIRSYEHVSSSIDTRKTTTEVTINVSAYVKSGPVKVTSHVDLYWENSRETETTEEFTTSYTIYDDDSTDFISQEYGIDKKFNSIIFRSVPSVCQTSYPLEHNTADYIPPILDFPEIELDSSHDDLYPCKDDSPIVSVDIFDEGGIQNVSVYYSINDGLNWDTTPLLEQAANPGTWQGSIPSQTHGTEVLWYVKAWDQGGLYSNRTDPHGTPYYYTVINRNPTITVLSPNGNESYLKSIDISWSAYDADDDPLTYTLAYSSYGVGWWLIDVGLTENSYIWNVSEFEYSDSVLVKVIVDDGFGGRNEDESDFLFSFGESIGNLGIEIVDQIFTTENFNLTFYIYDEDYNGVNSANLDMNWNGMDTSTNVTNLGYGYYKASLFPITVEPGEIPILLTINVSAMGYFDKYFEVNIAVDPESIDKNEDLPSTPPASSDDDDSDNNGTNGGEEVQLMTLILITVAPAVLITSVAVFLVRKRFKSRGIT